MNIAVVNLPFIDRFSRESRSPAVAKSGTLYYPMWLAYAVGYLEKHGHEVLFIDAVAHKVSFEKLIERLSSFNPSILVCGTSTPSIYSDVEITAKIKENFLNLFTVLVGVHVSALPIETLEINKNIDAVAYGEYDDTLRELADKLSKEKRSDELLSNIAGLAFRTSEGKIIKNKKRSFIEDLDVFPYVSSVYKKHLVDITPYFYGHSLYPIIVIMTGRGCPFHCTYCVVPQTMQGHTYRKRSVSSVLGEFKYIRDNFSEVKEIMIEDDTFTADRKRCREISEALIENGLTTIPWSANSRADVDYETLSIMKKAGCRLLCVGIESGDQQILNNIKKGTTLEKIERFMKDAKRAGILVHGCFMVGNRGETHRTLKKTLTFAKRLNTDTAQFFPIMVYPGTADYKYFEEKGWIVSHNFRDWITEEGLHSSTFSNPELTYEELVRFCDRARLEFYLRPQYIFYKLWQSLKNPNEAQRNIKAFLRLRKYLLRKAI